MNTLVNFSHVQLSKVVVVNTEVYNRIVASKIEFN